MLLLYTINKHKWEIKSNEMRKKDSIPCIERRMKRKMLNHERNQNEQYNKQQRIKKKKPIVVVGYFLFDASSLVYSQSFDSIVCFDLFHVLFFIHSHQFCNNKNTFYSVLAHFIWINVQLSWTIVYSCAIGPAFISTHTVGLRSRYCLYPVCIPHKHLFR